MITIAIHAGTDIALPVLKKEFDVIHHHPWTGNNFSEHWIIDDTVKVLLGVGGFYLNDGIIKIKEILNK